MDLLLPDSTLLPLDRPRIMGILNLTPDSFYDGGRHADPDQAVRHGLAMASQGADFIDVGGESTRPGAGRIQAEEQIARVVPVIRSLRQRLDQEAHPGVLISIDTTLTDVARAAVEAGATILNDVSAGREDAGMLALAAEQGLPIVLMHMQGEPGTMQDRPRYTDVVAQVRDFLLDRARAALDAGVDRRRIILDPGIGFGKTTQHNLALLRSIPDLLALGYPVMIGASRKRFIGGFGTPGNGGVKSGRAGYSMKASKGTSGGTSEGTSGGVGTSVGTSGGGGGDRLGGTCAVTTHGVLAGVQILRVHDVAPNRQAADLAWALSKPDRRKTS